MSGICGIWKNGTHAKAEQLDRMLAALELPEESRQERTCLGAAAFGVAGRWDSQQVATIPGVQIAIDADLLNEEELRHLTTARYCKPSEITLAELLGILYLEKGIDFVKHLDGAFALTLWDEREQRLILAIDRLGIRGLYWRCESERFLFGTRVGAVRAELDGAAEVNEAALMQYLIFSAVPAPMSIYKGVEKLPPGVVLTFEKGRVSQRQYWDAEYTEESGRSEGFWATELRETMRSSVRRHLSDNSPEHIGAYLSGGTDSSSVCAFLSEWQRPAKSFSIFFSDDRYNEISYARIAAKAFRTEHHELCLKPQDATEALPLIAEVFDEPFANSSAIGGYFCSRLARECGVTTLLAGDGGDELFGGNERYATDKIFSLYHSIPAPLRRGIVEPLAGLLPQDGGKLSLPNRYIRRASIPSPRRIYSYGIFLSEDPRDIFEPSFLKAAPPADWMKIAEGHFKTGSHRSELNRLLYMDIKMTLADNDLRKVVNTAELAGVRVRFPLLDRRLVELSGRIPSRLKLKGFRKRYIFKQAMKDILPVEIRKKKKHGFGVPVSHWFLQDARLNALLKDVLNDSRTRQRGYFRPAFFDEVIRKHRDEDAKNYGELIWYLVILELWHRQHLEAGTRCAY